MNYHMSPLLLKDITQIRTFVYMGHKSWFIHDKGPQTWFVYLKETIGDFEKCYLRTTINVHLL